MIATSGARPRRLMVTLTTALALGALTFGVGACGSDDSDTDASASGADSPLAKLKEKGVVRIGVADSLPTSGADTAKPTGLVPELTAMVFDRMGIPKAEPVAMDFGALIPSLQSGRIDVASGGFYVTEERCNAITFAEPAFYYLDAFAVKKGNPHNIRTYKDIAKADVNMGNVAGAANAELAEADGVKKDKIQDYPDIPSLLEALKADRIQAAPYDNVSIAYEVAKPAYAADLESTVPTAPLVDGKETPYSVSVGFPKDAGNIATEFDKIQAEMFAAGDFDALIKKWSVPKESIRPSDAPDIKDICAPK